MVAATSTRLDTAILAPRERAGTGNGLRLDLPASDWEPRLILPNETKEEPESVAEDAAPDDGADEEGVFDIDVGPAEVWYIQGQISENLALAQPLRVALYWGAGEVIAEQEDLNLHASGADRMDALLAVAHRIARDYGRVVQRNPRLSPSMQEVRNTLRRAVHEV
ncbi:MAG TPA: hypothetical protein VGM69_24175 [Chloroflexota bacterium]|jgi:hypothetical protein